MSESLSMSEKLAIVTDDDAGFPSLNSWKNWVESPSYSWNYYLFICIFNPGWRLRIFIWFSKLLYNQLCERKQTKQQVKTCKSNTFAYSWRKKENVKKHSLTIKSFLILYCEHIADFLCQKNLIFLKIC